MTALPTSSHGDFHQDSGDRPILGSRPTFYRLARDSGGIAPIQSFVVSFHMSATHLKGR
jgi:hypothetical protein